MKTKIKLAFVQKHAEEFLKTAEKLEVNLVGCSHYVSERIAVINMSNYFKETSDIET